MSDSTCSRCSGTGRFIGRNGRDIGPCWRCAASPVRFVNVPRAHGSRALPVMGALVAAVAFMAVFGHMTKSTAVAPAAPQIDYSMLANAVKAVMPATPQAVAAPVAPKAVAPKAVKHKAVRPAVRTVYVIPYSHGCTCSM